MSRPPRPAPSPRPRAHTIAAAGARHDEAVRPVKTLQRVHRLGIRTIGRPQSHPDPGPAAEVDSSETSLFGHWDTWVPEVSVAAIWLATLASALLFPRSCHRQPAGTFPAGRALDWLMRPVCAERRHSGWGTVNRDDPERWSIRPGMVFASGCRKSPAGRVFRRCARPARGDRATGMHAAVVVQDLRVDDGPVHAVRGVSIPVAAALDMAPV